MACVNSAAIVSPSSPVSLPPFIDFARRCRTAVFGTSVPSILDYFMTKIGEEPTIQLKRINFRRAPNAGDERALVDALRTNATMTARLACRLPGLR